MGDNQRNLAQFQASLNPFAGGDPPRSDGNSAASNIPAAAVAAAAMGDPGLWNEINRAMHYNNIQHAAAAAAAYNNSAGSGMWNQHQLQAQGENSRYFNSNFDRESENGSSPSIPRRIPSKGETKATPPLPPLSPHQLGGEMYRTLLAHQYDQYMAALAANMPTTHPPSPSPPSHRSLPPPANSPSSPVPTPRFSPHSQQKQAAAFLAVVAAATNRGHPSSLINGGDRLVSMPQVSPGGAPSHLTSSPSPSPLSGGEGSDADERSKHRRKQGQPRRQNVSSLPSDGSPTLPSDDSGSNRKSSPSANSLPSPPLTHDSLHPVRHPSDMPISQAMSHALAHPFLAAHLNPPSTPNHSNRNSPISPNLSNHSPLNSPKKSHLKGDHIASDMLQTLSGSNNPNSLGSENQHSNKTSNIQINNNSKVHGSLQRDSNVNSQKIDDQVDSCRSSIAGNNPSPHTDLGNSITTATNSYCRDDASPLPTTPGSCYSVDSEPPRTSNLAKIDQTRTASPLPSSPVVRNSSNGPFPRFAATPREVPVDMGSGPSTQYVEEDNIDIPCNNNKQFNNKFTGSITKTPAQKKSLSPLKTINLAALDNLYDDNDTSSEKNTSAETVSEASTNEETSMSNSSDSALEQSLITNKNTINSNSSESTACRKRDLDKKKISTATNKLRNKFKAQNSNESHLNEVINNCTKIHPTDSLVNGIDEQISANSKFAEGEASLVNGDCHATLSPTQSMKKIKKRKGQKESLSSPDSIEDGLDGADTRRRTRQKRAVSYVEDATDPVLETRDDGLGQISPGLISPGRKRGRRSKLAEFPSDGLVDALSPSSTATSDSFKDSISPERESVSMSLVSPTGGRGRRGRGRGRPPINHFADTSPSKEPIISHTADESKVYDFPDPLPSNNITSPNSRGKRGRGRKRGSPNKSNDRISKGANKSSLPNSVAIPCDDLSEDIQHNNVLNDETAFPTEENCNSYTKAPFSDINSKQSFPFLTVKDPSVLLEKYVSNSENIGGFPSIPNYSQCLVNSHENDSSGDGFPPSVAATDEVQKEDEAPPSIQYIPRMGRNRDSAMNSSRPVSSKETNVIEQVLLSLDKNIDDLSHSNKNNIIQQSPGNVPGTSNFQCNTLEPSKEGNRSEADSNLFNDSVGTKNSSPITRNRIKDPHSAAVQNLQLKSKGRKKEYPMEMNATVLTEKLLEPPNQPSLVQTSKSVNIDNIEENEGNMDRDNENVSYENSSTYATSIAEAVMRSGGRRTSTGKSAPQSNNQDSSTNLAEDSSSSSSSIVQSNINSNSSTPTKGRRSTRRSSQKANEPEVVQVEIHPEPQSSLSSYDPNSSSVEQRKPDDTKGPNNHKINVCAKLRDRVSNPPQNNMDDITVVPDVEPGFELRSRNTVNSSSERVAPSRCSKVTTPKSTKGVKTNSSDRKRGSSSSRFPKVQLCKKLKLDTVTDEKTDTGSSDTKVSVSENKSDILIADETSITDGEQLKNYSPSIVDDPKALVEDKINTEASSSNDAQPSTSYDDRPLRPKRTPKPPQTEEQINEVLMLLNMDSEESEDEDYVPKQVTVDSDQSMDESDDIASNNNSDEENSVKNDNCSDGESIDNQTKKNPHKRFPKTGLKRKKKSKGSSKLLKNGCGSKKRKVLIEKRHVVPDESVVDRSPFVQLIPSSGGEYINNDPSASVYEPQPPKSSLIHFHTELDSKNKAVSRVGFNSTLHTNYDAFSKDLTWFCSVCKKFSHSNQLGDLFGPLYIPGLELVKKNCQTVVDGQAQTDGRDAESSSHSRGRKRTGTIKHEVNSGSPAVHTTEKKSRVGLNTPADRCSLSSMSTKIVTRLDLPAGGITIGPGGTSNWPEKTDVKEVDSSPTGAEESQSFSESRGTETWIHESCLVWLPGVNVVNSRLRGIEESIILAQTNLCSICGETGASIGCLVNGCKNLVHYSCAEARGWSLDIDTFLSYCNNHKNRKANFINGGEVISERGQSSSVSEESVSRKDAGESTT